MSYLKTDSDLTGLSERLREARSHNLDSGYNRDQVKIVLNYDTLFPDLQDAPAPPFLCYIRDKDNRRCLERDQPARGREICRDLYNAACEPKDHFLRLDYQIAKNVAACNLRLSDARDVVLERAVQILSRLPARPIELDDISTGLSNEYLISSDEKKI